MRIDENKVEVIGGLLFGVGLILIFFGISAPLIAGAILSGSVVIARSINRTHSEVGAREKKGGDEPS